MTLLDAQPCELPPLAFTPIDTFETCPKQFHHKYILKDLPREAETAEQAHGTAVHKALELRLKDKTPLSADYAQWESLCVAIEQRGAPQTEVKLGVDVGFAPVGFWALDCAYRTVIDVLMVGSRAAWLGDWKTGKPKEKELQLKLSAGIVFANYPTVQEIHVNNIWLRTGKLSETRIYFRDDLPKIWQDVLAKVQPMEQAARQGVFPPRPSGLCNGWCPVRSCVFWREKK